MIWILYNALFAVGYTLMLPYFVFRMCRRGGYLEGFVQRFAVFKPGELARINERRRVWIHAVSVGEIKVAFRIMDSMRAARPGIAFFLTTTTSTAHALAVKKLAADDFCAYFPVDVPFVIRRELAIVQPLALLLVEGELWPNLIRIACDGNIPVMLVNGRISESSVRGYRLAGVFFRRVINRLKLLCVQSEADAARLRDLGTDPRLVRMMGSAKYDEAAAGVSAGEAARRALDAAGIQACHRLIVCGSTWPGEERILLDVFRRIRTSCPDARLVLVPRHAERAAAVEKEIRRTGLSYARRRALETAGAPRPGVDVLLVDTTGELMGFYSCADVVFVGKSLAGRGGQNIIEPAILGKPVIVGPHMENFPGVIDDFLEAGAIVTVRDAAGLEEAFMELLADRSRREEMGARARLTVEKNRGAIAKTVGAVNAFL